MAFGKSLFGTRSSAGTARAVLAGTGTDSPLSEWSDIQHAWLISDDLGKLASGLCRSRYTRVLDSVVSVLVAAVVQLWVLQQFASEGFLV